LVENLQFGDVECLQYALSKGLGVAIVAGGSIMKVPQIITIITSGSARGLSLPAHILETLSYGITLAYSVRNAFPFSTYGENAFLTAQNAIITTLIAALSARSPLKAVLVVGFLGASAYSLNAATPDNLALLQVATIPLGLASKIPQIAQNARARSTGQLSAFAVFSQLFGSLARLFTTLTEVGDVRMSAAFGLAFLLNAVIAFQVWQYAGRSPTVATVPINIRKEQETGSILNEKGTGTVSWGAENPGSSSIQRPASPIPRYGSPQGPRKWSRKVD
jgi:mannose-P-dolichol utilization defect protein 1